MSSYRIW